LNEKETLGNQQITKTGGTLDVSFNFHYIFSDRTAAGLPTAG